MEKLDKAKQLLALINEGITKEEFVKSFANIVDRVKRYETVLTNDFRQLSTTLTKKTDDRLAELKDGKDGRDGNDGKDGAVGPKGDKGEPGESIIGPAGRDGSPDMAEDVRNKLELLDGDERLKPEAVRGLVERLEALENRAPLETRYVEGGLIGRQYLQFYDLSPKLDGSTTTFSIPTVWKILNVQLSSLTPLRDGTDYTWTQTTITFTGLNAATQLAAGQSCLIIYVAA